MTTFKQLPLSELPRERLLSEGSDALSLHELVAILLGTGTQGKSVLILAQELLQHFGGLEGLLNATIGELTAFKGIGKAKAIALKAAFAIAKRAAKEDLQPQRFIKTVQDALDIAQMEIGHLKQEALLVILRDIKCRLIHHEVIGLGTLSEVLVHPREVFHPAIRHRAHSIIVCHNHPSGDATPSKADIALTKQLEECAKIIGIALVDHLIICKNSYFSMKNFKSTQST